MDRATILASLQQIADSRRELANALASGSADEYDAWLQQRNELEQSNPLAKEFLGSYDKYVDRMERGAINRALVVAGLAVAQDGPSALQSYPDPSTGQPFVYTETLDGFELQSGLQDQWRADENAVQMNDRAQRRGEAPLAGALGSAFSSPSSAMLSLHSFICSSVPK